MSTLSADLLHEMFEYVNGRLVRKVTTSPRAQAGMTAGTSNVRGYVEVSINHQLYPIHRLMFLMHHRYLPKQVEHIDNNSLNNRIENLRGVRET